MFIDYKMRGSHREKEMKVDIKGVQETFMLWEDKKNVYTIFLELKKEFMNF